MCGLAPGLPAFTADPPKKPDVAPPKFEVPYKLTDTKHVMVRVKLNGKGPFNLICDTGAPAVFITKAVAKTAGAKIDSKGWANFDSFTLEGGLSVDKARGRVEDLFQLEGMNGMGLAGVELHGVIGYNVLAKYRIQYDFTSDKLVWQPIPGFDPPAITPIGSGGQGGLEVIGTLMKFMASMMGVKVNFDTVPRGFVGVEFDEKKDGLFIKTVLPGSPAEKAGLKAGDKLDKIRNVDIDDARDVMRALQKATAGDKLTFKVHRGDKPMEFDVELGKGI
jgi:serine protease DegQ